MKTLRFVETPDTTHQRDSATPPEGLNLKFKDFGSYPKRANWLERTYLLETIRMLLAVGWNPAACMNIVTIQQNREDCNRRTYLMA